MMIIFKIFLKAHSRPWDNYGCPGVTQTHDQERGSWSPNAHFKVANFTSSASRDLLAVPSKRTLCAGLLRVRHGSVMQTTDLPYSELKGNERSRFRSLGMKSAIFTPTTTQTPIFCQHALSKIQKERTFRPRAQFNSALHKIEPHNCFGVANTYAYQQCFLPNAESASDQIRWRKKKNPDGSGP